MKKTETKPKSLKADTAKGVSVTKKPSKVPVKQLAPAPAKKPVKQVDKKLSGTPATAAKSSAVAKSVGIPKQNGASKPGAPVSKAAPPVGYTPSRPRRGRSRKPVVPKGPKPIPLHKNGPALQPSIATKNIKPEKEKKAGKDKNAPKVPMKLVQVIPKQKPSIVHQMPVKKEKMLMRFGKPTKRVLYTVDFLLKASPTILYYFMTTPSCLVRWFCDAVDITNEYYTFSWNGNTEVAELMDDIEDERLRFKWLDGEDEDEFFEFRISTADITDETILEIVDFAWADEVDEQKQLWTTQVDKLRKETGDA